MGQWEYTARGKIGRPRLFENPEDLWNASCEYFEHCDNNPWNKTDFKGKDVVEVQIPTACPYTISGLCNWLGCGQSYFRELRAKMVDNAEFSTVISRIDEIIETQQLEGATVGAFNANIVSRKLGLSDKQEIVGDGLTLNIGWKKGDD